MAKPKENKAATPKTESRIPEFKTVEEEAEFWDTHSTTEFEDEFEDAGDVRFIVTRTREKKYLKIQMPLDAYERLRAEAEAEDTTPELLGLLWIMERLVPLRPLK